MPTLRVCFLVVCGVILNGCASPAKWVSHPPVRTEATDYFEIRLNPIGPEASAFYDGFHFELVNRSPDPIILEWQKIRYLHDGQLRGTFVFQGLTPDTVRTPPPETVGPGERLSKTIWPLQLMGWVPMGDKTLDPKAPGFSPGVLPAGANGMALALSHKEERLELRLTVELVAAD